MHGFLPPLVISLNGIGLTGRIEYKRSYKMFFLCLYRIVTLILFRVDATSNVH